MGKLVCPCSMYGRYDRVGAHSRRRRGMSFVYFLSTAMLLTVVGLSSLMYVRIQRRTASGSNHAMAARFYAQSAIELGFAEIRADSTWRSTLGTGTWFSNLPIGAGTLSLDVAIIDDGDGNPRNDPVLLIGTGVHKLATHKIEVTLATLSASGGLVVPIGSWKRNTG